MALSGARGWFYELSLERSRESPGSCAFALSSGAQVRFEGLRAAGAWRLGLALEGSYAELSGGIFTAGFELRDSSLLEFTDPPTRGRDRGARRVDVLSRVAEVFERGSPR